MTTQWNEVLERLLSLQQLDSRIARLEARLTRAPADVKAREQAVDALEGKAKALQDRAKVLRAQILLRENDLRSQEKKIEKLKGQASEVRTNKEFVAFRSEIANAQGECDRIQNEVLKILEVVEQADSKIAELEGERTLELELVEKTRAQIREKLADVEAEVAGLRRDRPGSIEGIPKEQLVLYDRVRGARGRGMAALEGAYCSACGEVQTRNDVYAVQNRTRPVQCTGCNRILYQP